MLTTMTFMHSQGTVILVNTALIGLVVGCHIDQGMLYIQIKVGYIYIQWCHRECVCGDEYTCNGCKEIIIGVTYRPPNTCIEKFTDILNDIQNQIKMETKVCYILGDYNIDLLKCDFHKPSSEFLTTMFENSFYNLINRPTNRISLIIMPYFMPSKLAKKPEMKNLLWLVNFTKRIR